jgi:hypothetical protein
MSKTKKAKINDHRLRQRVIQLVHDTPQPVSMLYVAKRLNLTWTTARAILFDLSLNRQIKALKTTKSWVFSVLPDSLPPERVEAPSSP